MKKIAIFICPIKCAFDSFLPVKVLLKKKEKSQY